MPWSSVRGRYESLVGWCLRLGGGLVGDLEAAAFQRVPSQSAPRAVASLVWGMFLSPGHPLHWKKLVLSFCSVFDGCSVVIRSSGLHYVIFVLTGSII